MRFLGREETLDETVQLEQIRKQLQNKKSLQVASWAPVTTHLLDTGGPTAWNVMDNVVANPENFVASFIQEWEAAKLGEKFPPGCTHGDSRADEILALICNKFGADESIDQFSDKENVLVAEKGDKSIFIPHEYRRTDEFSAKHPSFALLLSTIQQTVDKKLSEYFTFDYELTTIQVEVYPGDGKSGYIRDFNGQSNKKARRKRMKDIVTATYFATPEDWDLDQHGGCLRIYNTGKKQHFDIPPYSNRLVVFRCDSTTGKHQLLPSRRPRMAVTVWYYGYNKREESQMERDFVFIDLKTGSVGSLSKDTLAEHSIIRLSDAKSGYSVVEAASKADEKSKLIKMIKNCESLGLGMSRPQAKANTGFGGEEAQLVAAKWGVALKKRVKNKEGEEMLFLDPNMNTIGEISRAKCIAAGLITITKIDENTEIVNEAESDASRLDLLEVVKEMMYTLEFDKHVEQNS